MSDTKHTPGPWEIVERKDTWNIKAGNRCIARLQMKDGVLYDANLIVAAPELYEALDLALELLCVPEHARDAEWHEEYKTLVPVLARARGEGEKP